MNTANEFAQKDKQIADLVSESLVSFENVFLKAIKQAQKENDISQEHNAKILAQYLISNMSGIRSMVKAGMKKNNLTSIIEIIINSLTTEK